MLRQLLLLVALAFAAAFVVPKSVNRVVKLENESCGGVNGVCASGLVCLKPAPTKVAAASPFSFAVLSPASTGRCRPPAARRPPASAPKAKPRPAMVEQGGILASVEKMAAWVARPQDAP